MEYKTNNNSEVLVILLKERNDNMRWETQLSYHVLTELCPRHGKLLKVTSATRLTKVIVQSCQLLMQERNRGISHNTCRLRKAFSDPDASPQGRTVARRRQVRSLLL